MNDYELTVFSKSLFSSDGSLLDGSKLKSDAVTEIIKATEVEPKDQLPIKPDCVVFDAMRVLNVRDIWIMHSAQLASQSKCAG